MFELLFNRCFRRILLACRRRCRHRTGKGLEISGAVLHGVNEEAECRKAISHLFEIDFVWRIAFGSEAADVGFAIAQRIDGCVLPHDHQRADDLSQRDIERGEVTALAGVAEETVKHLLDLREVALNFLGYLADEQFFLGLARHLVQRRHFGTGLGRIVGEEAVQTRHHHINLVSEVAAKAGEVFLSVLGEKDRCGDLHR